VSRFLDTHGIRVAERVPASRKLGAAEARSLIREASEIYVAKGRKLEHFSGGTPGAEIVGKLLGATGNLRSPTLRIGRKLVVGFNEEALRKMLL
jgi:hypothetical protein